MMKSMYKMRGAVNKYISGRYLMVMAIFLCMGCDKDDPMSGPSEPSLDLTAARQQMAVLVSDHFVKPAYATLSQQTQDLASTAEIFVADMTGENLAALQVALKDCWLSWQDAAIHQFGPTEQNALRAAINLYPSDSEKIEGNIMSSNYTFGSVGNTGAEGLPAVDYLVNQGTIEQVLALFNQTERGNYLLALTDHLRDLVGTVSDQWENGTFLQDFASDQSTGTDVGSAIGLLTNAIDLHFQRFLRDGKVAIPAGVRSAGVPRPKAVESLYGGYGRDLLVRALTAYEKLFSGVGIDDTKGTSFYRYLELIDQASIATDLRAAFEDAISKSRNLSNAMSVQIEQNNEALIDVFLSLQEIITIIKSDVASVMGITITNQDNDGD